MDPLVDINAELHFHIADADIQHRRLSQLVDELSEAVTGGKQKVPEVLQRLTTYLELHCADEEQFLETHDCPEELLRTERMEHAAILERLAEARRQAAPEPSLADVVRAWLKAHTEGSDRAYIEFFCSRGRF